MLTIFKKELRGYFTSGTAYIFMTIYLLISGIVFFAVNIGSSPNNMYASTGNIMLLMSLFLIPIITMKTISEETRNKTDQLLLTSPQSITGIVVGKYLAATALYSITVAITFIYPLILRMFGDIHFTEILSIYLGIILTGAAIIAIGVFISSLTDSQVVAAVATLGANFLVYLMDALSSAMPATAISGVVFTVVLIIALCAVIYFATKNVIVSAGVAVVGFGITIALFISKNTLFEGLIAKVLQWISLTSKYVTFAVGVVHLSSIIFFISFAFIFIYITIKMIDKRRWS